MSETLTNTQIIIKDDNGQIHTSKSLGQQDETRLNNMVKLMNLLLNTPNSTDFINTLASKAYVDSEVNKAKKEIGESVFSLVPLQNAGYHLYDGALINGSGSYVEFVSYFEQLYTNNPTWNCWTTEATWQSTVSTYGACGKFVVDTTNHTVRLPKVTGIVEGTIDANALGDLVEAGLPNLYGSLTSFKCNTNSSGTGVFANTTFANGGGYTSTATTNSTITFNAATHNPIYGNSNTVQPQTIKGYFYIVLANVTKTEIQVDIDNIASDLNGKADKDLSNSVNSWSNSAKIAIAQNAMPSLTYDDLTLGASGTRYTAPANGYVTFSKTSSAVNQTIEMYLINASNQGIASNILYSSASTQVLSAILPVKKGNTFSIGYTAGGTTNHFRFIYAVGSESEQ